MDNNSALALIYFLLCVGILIPVIMVLSPSAKAKREEMDLIDALQREVKELKIRNGELRDDFEREYRRRKSAEQYLALATQIREDDSKANAYPSSSRRRPKQYSAADTPLRYEPESTTYSGSGVTYVGSSWDSSPGNSDSGCGSDSDGGGCD